MELPAYPAHPARLFSISTIGGRGAYAGFDDGAFFALGDAKCRFMVLG